jgi:carboxypeptidase C (cathepsin A)
VFNLGGPGCSSAIAQFHENGPCKISGDATSTYPNPYSWNNNASMIYIDQPGNVIMCCVFTPTIHSAGVGFSYGDAQDAAHNETVPYLCS